MSNFIVCKSFLYFLNVSFTLQYIQPFMIIYVSLLSFIISLAMIEDVIENYRILNIYLICEIALNLIFYFWPNKFILLYILQYILYTQLFITCYKYAQNIFYIILVFGINAICLYYELQELQDGKNIFYLLLPISLKIIQIIAEKCYSKKKTIPQAYSYREIY
jgi:hypothetical protein